MFRRGALLLAVGACVLFAGCKTARQIPTGVQTVKGVIEAAPISLTRRGTHFIKSGGENIYLLESQTINIGSYEGQTVTVKGLVEPNNNADDVPVLVVQSLEGDAADQLKLWKLDTLGMQIGVPARLNGKVNDVSAVFTQTGSVQPVLRVFARKYDALMFGSSSSGKAAAGTTTIDGKRAYRDTDAEGGVRIVIDRGDKTEPVEKRMIVLSFMKGTDESTIKRVQSSVKFGVSASSSSQSSGSTASASSASATSEQSSGGAAGKPCGGAAGILCPTGYYCEITDRDLNIGKCKQR